MILALYIIKDKSSIIGKSFKRKFETGKKTIIKIPGFLVEKSKKKMDDLSKKADKIIDNLEKLKFKYKSCFIFRDCFKVCVN